jgi:putative DNA primase/helicase
MAIVPLQWRVKGLFPKTGMGVVFGQSGSGKSFLVLDLANSLAKGEVWFGRRTVACPVTYVSLEGEAGLKNRISALESYSRAEISPNFRAIIQPFSFGKPQDVVDLAAALPMDGVIFIDTLNRASAGLDENSGKDMSQILEAGKQLQELTSSFVIVVHHTGKDAARGMRGHSSLHAALDGALEVERTGNRRLWRAAKVKDGLDGEAVGFQLVTVPLGRDEDGELFDSCAIGPDTVAAPMRKEPAGASQKVALKALRRAVSHSSQCGLAESGDGTPCITIECAVVAIVEALPTVATNRRTNNARALITAFIAGDYVRTGRDSDEDWLWCLDG